MTQQTKICTKCLVEKPFSEFGKDRRIKTGLRSECKECQYVVVRNWVKNNKDKKSIYNKTHREKNKDGINNFKKNYYKERRQNDEQFRIKDKLGSIIRHICNGKRKGVIIKEQTYQKHLSCSEQEFNEYFENQFHPHPDYPDIMMTWENYGRSSGKVYWEIDHKIPSKHFDLTDIYQQKKYNFFKNLQPLWSTYNLLKSDGIKENINIPDILKDKLKDFTEDEVYKDFVTEEDKQRLEKYLNQNYVLEI